LLERRESFRIKCSWAAKTYLYIYYIYIYIYIYYVQSSPVQYEPAQHSAAAVLPTVVKQERAMPARMRHSSAPEREEIQQREGGKSSKSIKIN
jgi:hypothetical protein